MHIVVCRRYVHGIMNALFLEYLLDVIESRIFHMPGVLSLFHPAPCE
jgi:hypothetical protein